MMKRGRGHEGNGSSDSAAKRRRQSQTASHGLSLLSPSAKKKLPCVVFLGPPGVGKGTQGDLLQQYWGWRHLSGGESFRRMRSSQTFFGAQLRSMGSIGSGGGEYDLRVRAIQMMFRVSVRALASDASIHGISVDGVRSQDQASDLDESVKLEGHEVVAAIPMELDNKTVRARVGQRLVHVPSGRTYNLLTNPPKVKGLDDVTGEPLQEREGDKSTAQLMNRLMTWNKNKKDVYGYYSSSNRLTNPINCDASPLMVYAQICAVLAEHASKASPEIAELLSPLSFLSLPMDYTNTMLHASRYFLPSPSSSSSSLSPSTSDSNRNGNTNRHKFIPIHALTKLEQDGVCSLPHSLPVPRVEKGGRLVLPSLPASADSIDAAITRGNTTNTTNNTTEHGGDAPSAIGVVLLMDSKLKDMVEDYSSVSEVSLNGGKATSVLPITWTWVNDSNSNINSSTNDNNDIGEKDASALSLPADNNALQQKLIEELGKVGKYRSVLKGGRYGSKRGASVTVKAGPAFQSTLQKVVTASGRPASSSSSPSPSRGLGPRYTVLTLSKIKTSVGSADLPYSSCNHTDLSAAAASSSSSSSSSFNNSFQNNNDTNSPAGSNSDRDHPRMWCMLQMIQEQLGLVLDSRLCSRSLQLALRSSSSPSLPSSGFRDLPLWYDVNLGSPSSSNANDGGKVRFYCLMLPPEKYMICSPCVEKGGKRRRIGMHLAVANVCVPAKKEKGKSKGKGKGKKKGKVKGEGEGEGKDINVKKEKNANTAVGMDASIDDVGKSVVVKTEGEGDGGRAGQCKSENGDGDGADGMAANPVKMEESHTDSHTDSHAHAHAHSHGHSHAHSHGHSHGHGHSHEYKIGTGGACCKGHAYPRDTDSDSEDEGKVNTKKACPDVPPLTPALTLEQAKARAEEEKLMDQWLSLFPFVNDMVEARAGAYEGEVVLARRRYEADRARKRQERMHAVQSAKRHNDAEQERKRKHEAMLARAAKGGRWMSVKDDRTKTKLYRQSGTKEIVPQALPGEWVGQGWVLCVNRSKEKLFWFNKKTNKSFYRTPREYTLHPPGCQRHDKFAPKLPPQPTFTMRPLPPPLSPVSFKAPARWSRFELLLKKVLQLSLQELNLLKPPPKGWKPKVPRKRTTEGEKYKSKGDLHLHSTCSDGTLSVAELVKKVADAGVEVMSLTDHDNTMGVEEAMKEAALYGMRVVPGVEISAESGKDYVHVLGYWTHLEDMDDVPLQKKMKAIRESRDTRGRMMLEKLATVGVHISWERLKEIAGEAAIGRPHVAQAILEEGYIEETEDAYKKYLRQGCPCYVAQTETLTPEHAVELIKGAGGIAVLAHPWAFRDDNKVTDLLDRMVPKGLDGLEVYKYAAKTKIYTEMARKYKLLMTGGSDYHGRVKHARHDERQPGQLPLPETDLDKFLAYLQEKTGRGLPFPMYSKEEVEKEKAMKAKAGEGTSKGKGKDVDGDGDGDVDMNGDAGDTDVGADVLVVKKEEDGVVKVKVEILGDGDGGSGVKAERGWMVKQEPAL